MRQAHSGGNRESERYENAIALLLATKASRAFFRCVGLFNLSDDNVCACFSKRFQQLFFCVVVQNILFVFFLASFHLFWCANAVDVGVAH